MFMFKSQMERVAFGITIILSWLSVAQSQIFDITKYGGKPGSDISQAVLSAWGAACASPKASKIVIPAGSYPLKEVRLKGPCKAPIEVQVSGTITAPADPNAITKDNEWIMVEYVEHFTLSGNGVFDGQGGAMAWKQSDRCASAASCMRIPNNFAFNFLKHSVITGITSKNSKLFHISVFGCENVTISKVTIDAPALSPNTDGIHVGRSTGVRIADCNIATGDDCVSLGDGSKQVNVSGVNCGPGHGISIGSLGRYLKEQPVTGVYVTHCNLTNTDNGLRIKTWAGPGNVPLTASDIHFENIDMHNVSFPVKINQLYCPSFPCKVEPPSQVKISKVSFKGIRGTSATPEVVQFVCSRSFPCQGVEIGDINLSYKGPLGPARSNCTNVQPAFTGKQFPAICPRNPVR